MTDTLPPEAEAVLARITAADRAAPDIPAQFTGGLRELLGWWLAVAPGAALVPRDVMTGNDVMASCDMALVSGIAAADAAIDTGATLLTPHADHRDARAARTLIALLTRKDAATLTHQLPGMSDRTWMAECVAVRDGAARLAAHRANPMGLLGSLEAEGIAFVVGVLLASAARRTPCIVDGTDELAAALLADRMSYRATSWWRVGATSPDPARQAAVERMDLTPGLALGLTDETGAGARATVTLLASLADATRNVVERPAGIR